MKFISTSIISILSFILILNCASTNKITGDNILYVYDCDGIKLIYNPKDSTKTYIFPYRYKSRKDLCSDEYLCPTYQDYTVVRLFENGNIRFKLLMDSHHDYKWHEFHITKEKQIKAKAKNCFTVVPDSNMNIIELIRTSKDIDKSQNIIYSFETYLNYGSGSSCFEIKKIGKGKYAIRLVGITW